MPRFDIHIQLIDPTEQDVGLTFTFGHRPTIAVRGIQKLANRWLMQFLRRKGTDPTDLVNSGTYFPDLIGGNLTNVEDLHATSLEYVDDCNKQIQAIDSRSPWLDPDERLQHGELAVFRAIRQDAAELWVVLTAINGVRARVLIPYAHV